MEALMNETQVSEMLQVSLACLRRWRLLGEGPEYKKVGPLVRYRPESVADWVNRQPSGGDGQRFEPNRPDRRAISRRHDRKSRANPQEMTGIQTDRSIEHR